MPFKVKRIDVESAGYQVLMNAHDAANLGLNQEDRVRVATDEDSITCRVNITSSMVEPGEVGLYANAVNHLRWGPHRKGEERVEIYPTEKPQSIEFIKKKMIEAKKLTTEEIYAIVQDIVYGNLSEIELSAYVTSMAIRGMDMRETEDLTMAMVKTGEVLQFDKGPIFDFHSVGGVPGNKVTLTVVPIVAAAGMIIPKTSSRAISSACGTADIMESVCNVTLSIKEIKRISETVGATIAWGGGVNIAPADDLIIHVEYPLSIDPYAQVIASVMAKKKAGGAQYLLMDIPMGPGTKVTTHELARQYARDFIEIGRRIGIQVECAITYGGQPIGSGVGPAIETREALMALEGKPVRSSLLGKTYALAGILLEMGGVAQIGYGKVKAKEILESGAALKKFQEIVEAQGGKAKITSEDVVIGKYHVDYLADADGYVDRIYNKSIVKVARTAGSPIDKGAGVIFHYKTGDKVEKGDSLFTIYSNSQAKLNEAHALARRLRPINVEGMLIEHINNVAPPHTRRIDEEHIM